MKKIFNIGIVGAGLIGNKRADALLRVGGCRLEAIAEVESVRRKMFAEKYGCASYSDWKKLVRLPPLDVVIVAVPNAFATPIVIEALNQGKHVLCEKPFGIN